MYKRVGIFGGTFDPPHYGHFQLARKIVEDNIVDSILFIPAYSPPHKIGSLYSDYSIRKKMLDIFISLENKKVAKECFFISDIEAERDDQLSYTYETMNILEDIYPDVKFSIIIGGDSLLNLHTWYRGEDIIKRWNIITYPRDEIVFSKNDILKELKKNWGDDVASHLLESILNYDLFDISSTEIRDEVNKIIKEKGLYKSV